MIHDVEGTPATQQELVFHDEILMDELELASCGIGNGATLNLTRTPYHVKDTWRRQPAARQC